jgi:hypothetical protein
MYLCALFLVQGGMSTYLPAGIARIYMCSLMMISVTLSKHVGAVKVF